MEDNFSYFIVILATRHERTVWGVAGAPSIMGMEDQCDYLESQIRLSPLDPRATHMELIPV